MKEIKTVVFLSNFFNHHQKPFSDAMHEKLGSGYTFIETSEMSQERKGMGWALEALPCYVVSCQQLHDSLAKYEELIRQADVVIFGSAPYRFVKSRIKDNKVTFRYSERLLKKGLEPWKYFPRLIYWHWLYPQNKKLYLLCASAYAAGDYAKFFLFRNRAYKWGYFPKTYHYDDIDGLIERKRNNSLIWVARYLELKHPEIAVEIAKRLKQDGYKFELKMIGNGELLNQITERVKEENLDDVICFLGTMSPEYVRKHMELAQIHIFTSDRNEGWGAVLNESMNSACVPVVDRNIGSAPYLIEDGRNGYIYSNVDELYERVKYLLEHKNERNSMAKKAYAAITEEWNSEVAAERLLTLSMSIVHGADYNIHSGCCSRENDNAK